MRHPALPTRRRGADGGRSRKPLRHRGGRRRPRHQHRTGFVEVVPAPLELDGARSCKAHAARRKRPRRRRRFRAQPHGVVPALRIHARQRVRARDHRRRLASRRERRRADALDAVRQRHARIIRRCQKQQRRPVVGEQVAVNRAESLVACIHRILAALEARRHPREVARLLAQHAHAGAHVNVERRQRQKRIRADALHRIGNDEQPHPDALHKTTRERLGRHALHRHAVDVRGKRHHEPFRMPDRRRTAPQVHRNKGVAVLVASHADGAAQVRRTRRNLARAGFSRCPFLLDGLGKQLFAFLVRQAHAQRAHHQQIAVGARVPRRFRLPRPIGRKLRRPHLALHRPRGVQHVHFTDGKRRHIFVHLLNEIINRSINVVEHQIIRRHSFVLPPKTYRRARCLPPASPMLHCP